MRKERVLNRKGTPAAVLRAMAGRKVAKECGGSGGVGFVRVRETRPPSEAPAGKPPTLLEDIRAEFGLVGEVEDHSWWPLSGWQAIAMAVLTANRDTGRAKCPAAAQQGTRRTGVPIGRRGLHPLDPLRRLRLQHPYQIRDDIRRLQPDEVMDMVSRAAHRVGGGAGIPDDPSEIRV
jgi:hypothetical protein